MSRLGPFFLAGAVLTLFTACPTPRPPRVTPLLDVPQGPGRGKTDTLQTNHLAARPAAALAPIRDHAFTSSNTVEQWISLQAWARSHGFAQQLPPRNSSNTTYQLRNGSSAVAITIGSRVAFWNGLCLGLGFSPRFANTQPWIHSLDVQKNFEPLLAPREPFQTDPLKIVIDPGHGGKTPGAPCAVNHEFEKNYTLDWALRIQSLLAAKGCRVFLTRTKDVHLTLADRIAFADRVQGDLFISLHFNSVTNAHARSEHAGVETYCLTPFGMPSNLTRNFPDDPARLFPNNAFDAQNLQYAFRLHRALVRATNGRDGGVRRARFMEVLRAQNRPAVLLEGGYLTNLDEARLIAGSSYRQKLAEAVASAILE